MAVHPTAIVDRRADVHPSADVGPYVIIDGPVRVGANTRVYAHAYLSGWTEIGADCHIHPGAVVGHLPQDTAYTGDETYCRIGDATVIREGASVHRGTAPGSETVVGRSCMIMANAHVGHNCHVGDDVKLTNGSLLAGHVRVGDGAFISAQSAIHQFARVGRLVMVAGFTRVRMDVPPFCTVDAGRCVGVNTVGMRRAGMTAGQRADVKQAYRVLYHSGKLFRDALDLLAESVATDAGREIVGFLLEPSRRGVCGGIKNPAGGDESESMM